MDETGLIYISYIYPLGCMYKYALMVVDNFSKELRGHRAARTGGRGESSSRGATLWLTTCVALHLHDVLSATSSLIIACVNGWNEPGGHTQKHWH